MRTSSPFFMKNVFLLVGFGLLCIGKQAHAIDILGLRNPADFEQNSNVWVDASAMGGSTFRPLQNTAQDRWDSLKPREGQNLELVISRTSVGFSRNGWTFGVSSRQEVFGQAQKDTLDVYQSQLLGLPLASSKSYVVDYKIVGFDAQGIGLGKAFQAASGGHQVRLGVNATLLDAKRIKAQNALGQASTTGGGPLVVTGATYNDDSAINTVTNGFIPKFQNQTPSGSGYAVDIGLHYQHPSGAEFEWTVADATSQIQWKNVPEVTLSGSSSFNGQFPGGRKVLIDLTQSLLPKHAITARFPLGNYVVEATENVFGSASIFSAGVRRKLFGDWVAGCDYDFFFNAVGVTLSNSMIALTLRTDDINLEQARSLVLRLSARAVF